MSAELYSYYCHIMAIRIQCFVRQYFARRELDRCLQLAGDRCWTEHKSAVKIQSVYRGWLDSCRVQRKRLVWSKTSTVIQRIFRGKRVPRWQQTKMDAISQHVREQADAEHLKSLVTRSGYVQSSVGECEVDESPLNRPSDDELMKYLFGHSFIKLRCLIYWPDDGLYKAGDINGYDDRMQLWQIDYYNDDNEWLDLVREQDRVMVMEKDASDMIPYNYYRPLAMKRYLEERKTIEPSNSTWTPPDSREQMSSDVFYCSYVTRGLLDECYRTRSPVAIQNLKDAHPVKALTVSIAKVKQVNMVENCGEFNEMEQFERLLNEVRSFFEEDQLSEVGANCVITNPSGRIR